MSAGTTNAVESAALVQQKTEAVQQFILHHLEDSPLFPFLAGHTTLAGFTTHHASMVLLAGVLLIVGAGWIGRRRAPVPTGWANLMEVIVLFIRDQIAVPFLGKADGRRMTPLFCSLFFFILTMNLLGLIPCFTTATANVSVTAALALVVLSVMIFGAIARQGVAGFIKGFIPHGVPWPVLLILVPVELVGLFIKAFALSIRLFANEFAGHVVVFFLLGLVLIFGAAGLPFVALGALVYILEIGVAFLQAYIFTLLAAIFIGERYHSAH